MPLPPQVTPGSPIRFDWWNDLVKEVKALKTLHTLQPNITSQTGESAGIEVKVMNASGGDLLRWNILGIDSQLYVDTPVQDQTRVLKGITPDIAVHVGSFVVLNQDLVNNGIGSAFIGGTIGAYVNITDVNHVFCDITNADATQLTSIAGGSAQILWKSTGSTGKQFCVIRFPVNVGPMLAQCTSSPSGGSVSVKFIYASSGSAVLVGNAFTVQTL